MIDYRILLKKYISLIFYNEGTSFIDTAIVGDDPEDFTMEEIEELKVLRNEVA